MEKPRTKIAAVKASPMPAKKFFSFLISFSPDFNFLAPQFSR